MTIKINIMFLYYFFYKDINGDVGMGEEYFVMAKSLEAAKAAVINCPEWKERNYAKMEDMGVRQFGENEVVMTEVS